MPHIHTEHGQYDFTTSAFVVRRFGDGPKLLLHIHRKLHKLHKLLPVGGHIELSETPWEALRHELKEESGYDLEKLLVLQPRERVDTSQYQDVIVQPIPIHINSHEIELVKRHFHTDFGYVLVATDAPDSAPVEGESLDLRWFTRKELTLVPESEIWSNTRTNALSVFDTFLDVWDEVPATNFL